MTSSKRQANNTAPHIKTILVLGASGFIGQSLIESLEPLDIEVRTPSSQQVNFMDPDWQQIAALLDGVEVVINLVGVMSQDTQMLEQVHHLTPLQIAQVAKQFHVKHWVNLSALGANEQHAVPFLSSKGRGDAQLLALVDEQFKVSVIRPSLVFGRGGMSTETFVSLAKLPILILPERGRYLIQPVHINDLVQGLMNLGIDCDNKCGQHDSKDKQHIINATGGEAVSFADYLITLRHTIHNLPAPIIIGIPNWLAYMAVSIASLVIKDGILNKDSLHLLAAGSIADNQQFRQLIGYKPLGYKAFKY